LAPLRHDNYVAILTQRRRGFVNKRSLAKPTISEVLAGKPLDVIGRMVAQVRATTNNARR
jgi:hypothetical protein